MKYFRRISKLRNFVRLYLLGAVLLTTPFFINPARADRPAVLPTFPKPWEAFNGDLYLEHPFETIGISLSYHSAGDGSWNNGFGGYGQRMALTFDSAIVKNGNDLELKNGSGRSVIFHQRNPNQQIWYPEMWPYSGNEFITVSGSGYKEVFIDEARVNNYLPDPTTDLNRLASVVDQFGNSVVFQRSAQDPSIISKIVFPFSKEINFEIKSGKVSKITDSNGVDYNLEYDATGRLHNVSGIGTLTVYEWSVDGSNRIVAEGTEDGKSTQYNYNDDGSVSYVTDTYGNISQYKYSPSVVAYWALGREYALVWDSDGNLISQKSRDDSVDYQWDQWHRLTSASDAWEGQTMNFQYDPVSDPTANDLYPAVLPANQVSGYGSVTTSVLDPLSYEPIKVIQDGQQTDITYQKIGDFNFVASTKQGDAIFSFQRDPKTGALISSTLNGVKTYWVTARDSYGRVTGEEDITGNTASYVYSNESLSHSQINEVSQDFDPVVEQPAPISIVPVNSGQPSTWPKLPLSNEWYQNSNATPYVPDNYNSVPTQNASAMLKVSALSASTDKPSISSMGSLVKMNSAENISISTGQVGSVFKINYTNNSVTDGRFSSSQDQSISYTWQDGSSGTTETQSGKTSGKFFSLGVSAMGESHNSSVVSPNGNIRTSSGSSNYPIGGSPLGRADTATIKDGTSVSEGVQNSGPNGGHNSGGDNGNGDGTNGDGSKNNGKDGGNSGNNSGNNNTPPSGSPSKGATPTPSGGYQPSVKEPTPVATISMTTVLALFNPHSKVNNPSALQALLKKMGVYGPGNKQFVQALKTIILDPKRDWTRKAYQYMNAAGLSEKQALGLFQKAWKLISRNQAWPSPKKISQSPKAKATPVKKTTTK